MKWALRSRLIARFWLVFFASLNRYIFRYLPNNTNKVLIPTQLLLGDCVLMLSLIEKAIKLHPSSQLVVAAPSYAIAIFSQLNLPVTWVTWAEKDVASLQAIRSLGPYRMAYIPFEKWASVWANAFGAKEVVGFTFQGVKFHDSFLTRVMPLPTNMLPISDWLMQLVSGDNPAGYIANKQLFKDSTTDIPLALSQTKKIILHIGARNENRRWTSENWTALAEKIRANDMQVVWTYAANEQAWGATMGKRPQDWDTEGKLSFDALISLIANVDAVISPDTGIAHLCKLTATPSVVIYGQGNPAIHGNGEYWRFSPVRNIFLEDIPCRSMQKVFGRYVKGVTRCDLGPSRCANPYCQNTISPEAVFSALDALLQEVPTNS